VQLEVIVMSARKNKALIRHLIKGLNKGKAAAMTVIDELYATDVIYHRATGENIHGIEDYKQVNTDLFDGFPDIHFIIDDIIAEWDRVASRCTFTGTQKRELRSRALQKGIPPTNKKVTVWAIYIDRVAGGKIVGKSFTMPLGLSGQEMIDEDSPKEFLDRIIQIELKLAEKPDSLCLGSHLQAIGFKQP
jgi:predicted ester cyclase